MPSRIIRECALTSPSLDALSDGAERLFFRLTVVADDQGRFEADPRIVLAKCFPLRAHRMKLSVISQWLAELGHECIQFYTVRQRVYGVFRNWAKYQRIYGLKSKFPQPPADSGNIPQDAADSRSYPISDIRDSRFEKKKEDVGVAALPPSSPSVENSVKQAEEVLEFLNQKTGRHFRLREGVNGHGRLSSNAEFILARLKSGATVEQCRQIIAKKTREWADDPKMVFCLRPATLFNRTKFEQYLGELLTVSDAVS